MNIVCSIRKTLSCAIVVAIGALSGCAPAPGAAPLASATPRSAGANELVVFAAASLKDAFTEIGAVFEAAHPGVKILFSFAGSNQLRVQIEQGAQADVFASAGAGELQTLAAGGLIAAGTEQVFARNRLTIVVPRDNPANIRSPRDLARPGVKLVLANDRVPAGQYARQVLARFAANVDYGTTFSATVLANVVSNEENVKQVVEKVQLGEADAGIAYISDVTPRAAARIAFITIPDAFNVTADYPIAPLRHAPHAALAAQFVQAVLSAEGQAVLKKWGFERVP